VHGHHDIRTVRLALAVVLLGMGGVFTPSCVRADVPDGSTPRRALRHFVDSARAGDYQAAAAVLDLGDVLPVRRAEEGPRLARQLAFVLDRELWIDWDKVSDGPEGDPADGPGANVVGEIPSAGARVPIRLVRLPGGEWRIARATVHAIPELYERHGPGWIAEALPAVLVETRILEVEAWQWLGIALGLALASLVGLFAAALARALSRRLTRTARAAWDGRLVETMVGPARLLLGLGAFAFALEYLRLAAPAEAVATHLIRTAVIVAVTWAGLRSVGFLADLASERLRKREGGAARTIATRIMVLRRVAGIAVAVVGGSLVLLQFEGLRTIGTSLLASAGVAGLVVGLAAQRSIGTLLAGLQVSLAEPFRVGDVVVMEGEWGTIEEITLTYVVLKIWDQRRLVIPIGRVLEAPLQNWSRTGTDLMGTVFLHADYRVPVEAVRREVERLARTRPEWDGKVAALQVTDATDRSIELRVLVSASDAGKLWDLRCAMREHLVTFLQGLDGGRHLPRLRIESAGQGDDVAPHPLPGSR
jgi:small-conductance mechanosensitive channel